MTTEKSKTKGILFALGAGFGASILWIVIGLIGFYAAIAGFLMGLAAYKAYVYGHGKFDKTGKILTLAIILISIPVSELIITLIQGVQLGIAFLDAVLYLPTLVMNNLWKFWY